MFLKFRVPPETFSTYGSTRAAGIPLVSVHPVCGLDDVPNPPTCERDAMCSHYQAVRDAALLERAFGAKLAGVSPRFDMRPKYQGVFIRRPLEHDAGDDAVPFVEASSGQWGLVSALAKTPSPQPRVNARTETVATTFTFKNAWRKAQHCIIPAQAIFEPDWRSTKHVATRFTRVDGKPLGIAGLWDRWRAPDGNIFESFTMLTINAANHSLFKHYHRPEKEKRMVVILPESAYGD